MIGVRRQTDRSAIRGRIGHGLSRSAGFSLLTALFLLVVVAGLGGYLVSLATTQHLAGALAAQSSRAYYLAQSGLQWAAYRIQANPGACPAAGTSFLLEGFTVSLDLCNRTEITEGSDTYAIYDLQISALSGEIGDATYVTRSLRVTFLE
jgi:MSHA biogenesis protein MshP